MGVVVEAVFARLVGWTYQSVGAAIENERSQADCLDLVTCTIKYGGDVFSIELA